jgi:hypothetical protein
MAADLRSLSLVLLSNRREKLMKKYYIRTLTRMKRVKKHCDDHVVAPANPTVTAEATALDTVITAVEAAAVAQDGGAGAVTSAVDSRLETEMQLRQLMASLAKAGRRLDKDAYPDVAGKLRMAGINSFPKLLTRAMVFKETLATAKPAFVALGAPADVDVELDDLITALESAGDQKTSSLDTQIGGTLGIAAKVREGIDHMRELDAIFTQLYRKNLVMLALWKVANRATPYTSEPVAPTPDPVPGDGSGSGSGS